MSTDNVVRHVLDNGTIEYRNTAGELHRTDGPAVMHPNGTKKWYLDGERHREDGPAVVYPDGTKGWYRDGERHREGGPAVVWFDGTEEWFLNNKRHREGGPAVVYPDGTKKWYLNGVFHCADGPAVVKNGNCEYWIDGTFIIGKTTGDVYCLERDSGRLHQTCLSTDLVVKVMSDKGFGSVEDFVSWLAFVVLGEEAVPVLARAREEGTPVLLVLDEYLRNHEDYAGLPFSWWYPIVEGAVNQ